MMGTPSFLSDMRSQPGWTELRAAAPDDTRAWVYPPAREGYKGPVVFAFGRYREDWAHADHPRNAEAKA